MNRIPVFTGTTTLGSSPIALSNGNVGIGTTAPWSLLSIGTGTGASPGGTLGFSGINGTSYDFDLSTTAGNYLQILSEQPNAVPFVITGSGNVGIGTTSPGAKLEIASGTQGQTGPVVGLQIDGPNSPGNSNSAQDIRFAFAAAGSSRIRAYRGGGWDTYLQFLTNPNQGYDLPQVQMTIDSAGSVGIGTTAPGARLEVDGNVKLTAGSGASMTFQDGSVQSVAWNGVLGGGDYAESVDVSGDRSSYEPGDVLVIDSTSEGRFLKSSGPYSTAVMGIYSTKPGVIGRRQVSDKSHMKDEVPMAMVGVVPTKVIAESGAIRPGDLLVTSSTPGYAMKGTDRGLLTGAIIGKALGHLDSGTGLIDVAISIE